MSHLSLIMESVRRLGRKCRQISEQALADKARTPTAGERFACFESLEPRRLLTAMTVTTLADTVATDTFVSIGKEGERATREATFLPKYQVNRDIMKLAKSVF